MSKKVVLITGGTRGIGLGIGQLFHQRGYRVVLNYHQDDESAQQVSNQYVADELICVKADISDKLGRAHLIKTACDQFGGIDVLVNNAAIIKLGRVLEIEDSTFQKVMNTNFYAAFFLAQQVANHMIATKKKGAIVNILSVGAYGAANISYGTSKAALMYATRCMAKEMATHRIRVNSISPNAVPTGLNETAREQQPERWQKAMKKIPLQREATAEDMAKAVFFLASDEASYITGVDVPVDGGLLC